MRSELPTWGIDLGSRTTKLVAVRGGRLESAQVFDTSHRPLDRVREALEGGPYAGAVATGYGRHLVQEELAAQVVTEIRACAHGAVHLYPQARMVIDIGGQDCKVIELAADGGVEGFQMNDRCAAGTGRFMEVMAALLHYDLESFWREACEAEKPATISSMCTVFAESEVISLLTSGTERREIALGLHHAIVDRLYAMIPPPPEEGQVALVGGGARNQCLRGILGERLGCELLVPEDPQIVSALGAAMLGEEEGG